MRLTTRIDELLNAALAHSGSHTPSLAGFIQWFDAGEGELKREAGASAGLVRVMTVHGSKGLQAPIVILADATGNPDRSPTRGLTLQEDVPGGAGRTLPILDLSKEEKVGRIAAAEAEAAAADRQEHWRLLYVAMTRAEEALFIGGALLGRDGTRARQLVCPTGAAVRGRTAGRPDLGRTPSARGACRRYRAATRCDRRTATRVTGLGERSDQTRTASAPAARALVGGAG